MRTRIVPLKHLQTADEIELLNRMLRDLGRAAYGDEDATGTVTPPTSGVRSHHALDDLTNYDDHTQYLYLPGRPRPGQAVKGRVSIYGNATVDPQAVLHLKGEAAVTMSWRPSSSPSGSGFAVAGDVSGHLCLDEAVPDDITTYIFSLTNNPSYEAKLTFNADPASTVDFPTSTTGWVLKIRYYKTTAADVTFNYTLKNQGGSTVKSGTFGGTPDLATGAWTTITISLSAAEAASLIGVGNESCQLLLNGFTNLVGTFGDDQIRFTWIELSMPGGAIGTNTGGKTLIVQADSTQVENLAEFQDGSGNLLSKVLVDGTASIARKDHIDTVSGIYGALYVRAQYLDNLQSALILEKKDTSTADMVSGYRTQVAPGVYGNKVFGITSEGDYNIQNIGKFATGDDGAPAVKANTNDDLVEFKRDSDSWTDVKFSATLAFGWNSTVTGIFCGKDPNSKADRFGFCVNEGVEIGNVVRASLTPPLALLHVKNFSGAAVIPGIFELPTGATADTVQFKKNGVVQSAIDKDGNFTGGVTPAAGSITAAMIANRTRRVWLPLGTWVQSEGTGMARTDNGTHPDKYESYQFVDNPAAKPQALLTQIMIPEDYSSNLELFMWYTAFAVGFGGNLIITFRVHYKYLSNGNNPEAASTTITNDLNYGANYTTIVRQSLGNPTTGVATGKLLRLAVDRDTNGSDDTTDTIKVMMFELVYTADS